MRPDARTSARRTVRRPLADREDQGTRVNRISARIGRWRPRGFLVLAGGVALLLVGLLVPGCGTERPGPRAASGPWDLTKLAQPPAATWGMRTGLVQEVWYEGEPFHGQPTRVFGYVGRPSAGTGPFPAMVLVHGGGGKAFPDWASHWAQRGYVALAMDLAGQGPAGRLPDGGPDQSDQTKFRNFGENDRREMWSYHAVAAVLRGHSLLASLPEVDRRRIGITGISWGGYLTCIVAGVDSRLKVAVPVYGCGFLHENSVWKDQALAAMEPDARQRWIQWFDPSQYLEGVACPILFLNGSNDFAYPMDSYRKSYRLVRDRFRHVSIIPRLKHGHYWEFEEVDAFVDHVLRGGPPLAHLSAPRLQGKELSASVRATVPLRAAELNYTASSGPWQQRLWEAVPAELRDAKVFAQLPAQRPLVAYLSVTDQHGLRVSTEHLEVTE